MARPESGTSPAQDVALVSAMLKGDEKSFHEFFDLYFARVYRFALPRLGGDVEAAKEVVQATLVKAVRALQTWRGDAPLFTWLCQICRRQLVDHLRATRRYHERVVLIEDNAEMRSVLDAIEAPAEDEPERRMSRAETHALVQAVLNRLPSRYGDVLEWKYIDGRTVEEIGERLGVGVIATQSMLARARTAFREALETVFGATAQEVIAELASNSEGRTHVR